MNEYERLLEQLENPKTPTLKVGDRVKLSVIYCKDPKDALTIWRVTRFLTSNVECEDAAGKRLRAKPYMLEKTDQPMPSAEDVPIAPPLGALVRVTGGRDGKFNYPVDQLFVVIKTNSDDTVNIAKLGGEGNRYWRKMSVRRLQVVDPAEVLR